MIYKSYQRFEQTIEMIHTSGLTQNQHCKSFSNPLLPNSDLFYSNNPTLFIGIDRIHTFLNPRNP
jgi:hypothetical protein